ncbi:MAG: HDIG domain-containing protein [Candidatus Thermoplasmatota archaeon]|jgi:uncharacterized protein (TIGR00295 family)|nr:HDIG domain-containing protein [Candidatus Thermoplasmatota archaeon]MDP7266432.1 HDIG domain-containing protein [Candidatus Thermoplasmatota archaeon]
MVNNMMDYEKCIQTLIKYGVDDSVIIHSQMVERLANKIGQLITANNGTPQKVNFEIMRMGALLHDIGRSKTHNILHVIEGVRIARELNLPSDVIHIIENHIGSGLTPEEAYENGLEKKNYFPQTLEAKLVAYADNLIAENRQISLSEGIRRYKEKGLATAAERLEESHRYLTELAGTKIYTVRI